MYLLHNPHLIVVISPHISHFILFHVFLREAKHFLILFRSPHSYVVTWRPAYFTFLKLSMFTPVTNTELEDTELLDLFLWRLVLQYHTWKHSLPVNLIFIEEYWSICSDTSSRKPWKYNLSFGAMYHSGSRPPSQHSTHIKQSNNSNSEGMEIW